MREARHAEQMNRREREMVEALRRHILEVARQGASTITAHCQEEMEKDRVQTSWLRAIVRDGKIIEVSRGDGGYRIVCRLEVGRDAHCAVFSQYGEAVTYWRNWADDQHGTLDLAKYAQRPWC